MESDPGRELSDLSLNRKECKECGAVGINGQHIWSGTGNKGNELDLAGLVCNKLGDANCINPCKGKEGGVTWAERLDTLDKDFPQDGELKLPGT